VERAKAEAPEESAVGPLIIDPGTTTPLGCAYNARRTVFAESLPVTAGRVPDLEITVRFLVFRKSGNYVEWTERWRSWARAWRVVDDCGCRRETARVWCPAVVCSEFGLADDLYVPGSKMSGWWIIDLS
jgi:hypothetical protein